MISVRVETPPPAAPVRGGAVAERAGREAPGFDDAMRKQEGAAALARDADEALKDDGAAEAPAPDVAPVQAPPPVPLATLIAQMLPQAQQAPQGSPTQPQQTQAQDKPALQLLANAPARSDKAAVSGDVEQALDLDAPAPESVEGVKPRQKPHGSDARDQFAASAKPIESTPAGAPEKSGRAGHADSGAGDAPTTRHVAVRNVSTATHFPVTADPIRQIANEVTRAVEAPAPTSPTEPQASPVKTVNVQLEPESLGTVTLRMRLSGDTLSVRVEVAEPATLQMIQRERDRLQKSMATDSVSIDRLEIRAAGDPTPVSSGDNANAPKQDMNAPGQQARQNTASQGGEQRRDSRGDSHPRSTHGQRHENDSTRGDDPRGVYL
jgi:chemotaxis protein MotD